MVLYSVLSVCSCGFLRVQAKGLEFCDVLIYNFFGDSVLDKKWRVLYQYLVEIIGDKDKVAAKGFAGTAQKFDSHKHALLCK